LAAAVELDRKTLFEGPEGIDPLNLEAKLNRSLVECIPQVRIRLHERPELLVQQKPQRDVLGLDGDPVFLPQNGGDPFTVSPQPRLELLGPLPDNSQAGEDVVPALGPADG